MTDEELYPPAVAVWLENDGQCFLLAAHEYAAFVKAIKDGRTAFEGETPDGDDIVIVMQPVVAARKMSTETQVKDAERRRLQTQRSESDLP